MSHLRIGVWFDERHMAFGGPTVVLLGTILGFFQDAAARDESIRILLNEPGDVNWELGLPKDLPLELAAAPNLVFGPMCFKHSDGELRNPAEHALFAVKGHPVLFASDWFREWVCHAVPFPRALTWGAGVDTDFFTPSCEPPSMDFFIYFKSQRYEDLGRINDFLFNEYFGIRGTVLTYYSYDAEMLRNAAQSARFCIMLDRTETQGLAALEIMACGCPLFVLDETVYEGVGRGGPATSVTCWDVSCGMKSSFDRLRTDFPAFLTQLPSYTPRAFVETSYSFAAAAGRLREIMHRAETS